MANKTVQFRGPKRKIEKVWSRVNHAGDNVVATKILYTATDSVTLVRMRVQGQIIWLAGAPTVEANIARAPAGTAIDSVATTEQLDNDDSKLVLWSHIGTLKETKREDFMFEADSKAMRKMNPGDTILWKDKGDIANGHSSRARITLWFKD